MIHLSVELNVEVTKLLEELSRVDLAAGILCGGEHGSDVGWGLNASNETGVSVVLNVVYEGFASTIVEVGKHGSHVTESVSSHGGLSNGNHT